jgi:RNA polymerase sigma factor (TIGR02999 family)
MNPGGERPASTPGDLTRLLRAWRAGDEAARERLMERVYSELRKIAGAQMRRERRMQTLEVTGLVHEAFLRLSDQRRIDWRDRVHFFGLAATCMRRVLVDRARARAAAKRNPEEFVLTEGRGGRTASPEELLDLDRALEKLAVEHPRLAQVVEMRWFAGLELVEIGEVLGVSDRTVKRDWAFARAWLLDELAGGEAPAG